MQESTPLKNRSIDALLLLKDLEARALSNQNPPVVDLYACLRDKTCLLACLSPLTKSAVLQQPICLEKRLQMK